MRDFEVAPRGGMDEAAPMRGDNAKEAAECFVRMRCKLDEGDEIALTVFEGYDSRPMPIMVKRHGKGYLVWVVSDKICRQCADNGEVEVEPGCYTLCGCRIEGPW